MTYTSEMMLGPDEWPPKGGAERLANPTETPANHWKARVEAAERQIEELLAVMREVSDTFWVENGKDNTGLLDAMVKVRNVLHEDQEWVCAKCGKPVVLDTLYNIWDHKHVKDMAGVGYGHDIILTLAREEE